MDGNIEHELCNNCKKEIPQTNYVMHTMHCARNITLCPTCKEPVPKSQFDEHKQSCTTKRHIPKKPSPPPPTNLERSSYFQTRKAVEDKKVEARKDRYMQRMDRLVDSGHTLNTYESQRSSASRSSYMPPSATNSEPSSSRSNGIVSSAATMSKPAETSSSKSKHVPTAAVAATVKKEEPKSSGMLACKFCDLELPKLDLEDHENYCGSRTDKCLECGELVMFKDKQSHMDSNHAYLKSSRGRGGQSSRPTWDSSAERASSSSFDTPARRRPLAGNSTFGNFDYDPMPYLPSAYQSPGGSSASKKKEGESYKEISRRLDCKTEYIRNLLHDSAGITIPLRRNGTTPRNHFNHNKALSLGPAPQPPASRRRNPPTELVIPCEFCGVPIPHEDLIQHETGCRPDLARYRPRRHLLDDDDDEDDYSYAPPPHHQREEDDEELPCEFCGDMIPASQLLGHQIRCN